MSGAPILSLEGFRSVFVVKPSSLGDIIHTLPSVHLLKQACPDLEIRWVCNPEWMPLLTDNPDLTEVIPFPRQKFKGLKGLGKLVSWSRALKKAARSQPEIALDFQGLMRSALICRVRGANPIVGLSDAREGASLLYHHVVPVNAGGHAVDRYLEMVRAFGIEVQSDRLVVPLPRGRPPEKMELPENYIVLHPYARGADKSLSTESIQALCDALAPHPVLIVGRSHAAVPVQGAHVFSLVNETDLHELIWLLRQAKATISVDSGPMHIAAALTDRALGIHTWSDPRKVGPYNSRVPLWKASRIASRTEFSDAEAAVEKNVGPDDARAIADFVLREWF